MAVADVVHSERPDPAFTVVQALPKGERGELAVEVLTEVGVDVIVPWAASRSVAVWKGERAAKSHAKWQATAREAAKQSRRSWLPTVTPLASTADAGRTRRRRPTSRSCSTRTPRCRWRAWRSLPRVGSWSSSAPRAASPPRSSPLLEEAGARPVRLGDEVLRTSTAGVVAVAALLARTPRWT